MSKRELNISDKKLYNTTKEDIIFTSPSRIPPKGIQDLVSLKDNSKKIFVGLKGEKKALSEEKLTINFAFASVTIIKNIKKNERFTKKNIFTLRPYNGFYKVKDFKKIIGKKASKNLFAGEQLKKNDVK